MTVFTLLETDTDTNFPTVSVWADHNEAIAAALRDIQGNGNRIDELHHRMEEDAEGRRIFVWTCHHVDQIGEEHLSEVKEHHV